MVRIWQLQDAKNRFSEVVEEAVSRGPQVITKRGIETAVILSYAEYRRLQLGQGKISDFFRQAPLIDAELDLSRDTSAPRDDINL
ncbi:MAG: type II toxin-antitoxin system Phd/YefM family antitoxin [Chloroflexaceae bacterium]|jgi:prevent-host-death family protein|nr:type II toxin-antitoxin system Phd/YefM family antitoxin [Chloroflexaceae bacterium]